MNLSENEYIGASPDIGVNEYDFNNYLYPIADFDANIYEGQVPLSVQFTNSSISIISPLNYNWNFGDGTSEQNSYGFAEHILFLIGGVLGLRRYSHKGKNGSVT